MRVEKRVLNDALCILGKVVCQNSPVELYRAIRFAGDPDEVRAMATDGKEVVSLVINAMPEADVDFCVPYKDLKELVRISRNETLELTGKMIEFPQVESVPENARTVNLDTNFCEYLAQAAPPHLWFPAKIQKTHFSGF